MEHKHFDVCLVNLPFDLSSTPSLGLSILKRDLSQNGISSTVLYPEYTDTSQKLSDLFLFHDLFLKKGFYSGMFAHIFAELTDLSPAKTRDEYLEWLRPHFLPLSFRFNEVAFSDLLENCRTAAKHFIDRAARQIASLNPKVLGCIASLNQTNAGLALCKAVKALNPDIITVLGGSACKGEAGLALVKIYPSLDFVCSGEGEIIFAKFCTAAIQGSALKQEALPFGILSKQYIDQEGQPVPIAYLENLDLVPCPDYTDFFAQKKGRLFAKTAVSENHAFKQSVHYDASRGCQWAERAGCAFCALNGTFPKQRVKSVEKVIADFKQILTENAITEIMLTDNYLNKWQQQNLLPAIKAANLGCEFFWETRVAMSRADIELMQESGVRLNQAGIESLNQRALQQIRKGTTVMQNVEYLKQTHNLGITTFWNILGHLPEEAPGRVAEEKAMLELICHLQAPQKYVHVHFLKDSIYQVNSREYKLDLQPYPFYQFCFPDSGDFIGKYATYYIQKEDESYKGLAFTRDEKALRSFIKELLHLEKTNSKYLLKMADRPDGLFIIDTRPIAAKSEYILTGLAKELYLYCDESRSFYAIKDNFKAYPLEELTKVLADLCKDALMLNSNAKFLALATIR